MSPSNDSDNDNENEIADEQPGADAAPEGPEGIDEAADDGESGVEASAHSDVDDAERVGILEGELAEVTDQMLRAVAETENVRRRAQRDKVDAGKYGIASFAREMLSVADNMGRALESEKAAEEKQANAELSREDLLERFNNFVLGVKMTETEMLKTLERIGIKKIAPIGEPFDPKLHHALFEMEDLEKPAGTVTQVIDAGYVLHDRLLREAKVGISKGGPKLAAGEASQETDPGEAEGAAQAYEQAAETGSKVDKQL